MKKFKKFLWGFAIVLLVLLTIAAIMKKDYCIERKVTLHYPEPKTFTYLRYLRSATDWSPWEHKDPKMKSEYIGSDGYPGVTHKWDGNDQVGKGEQEIKSIDTVNRRIDSELRFEKPWEAVNRTYLITKDLGNGNTEVTWGFTGSMPYPMNIMIPFLGMDKYVGKDFEDGLAKLKTVLESYN